MKLKLSATLVLGAVLLPLTLSAASDAPKRLQSAAQALKEVMGIPDKSIPQDLLNRAECIVIVPDLKKGAFIIGGKYGKGFVSCRKKDGAGWSAPGSVRVEGGSVGLQIGGSEMDVFMLVMNDKGVERLLGDKFTLGGDVTVAAGPVGRVAQAETDAKFTAEILTWSRARGLFAGVALNGATLREDEDWNSELYGKHLTNREIVTGSVAAPKAAATLLNELDRYSSRK
jgi:lipid-binding SYLF domain-containing protein